MLPKLKIDVTTDELVVNRPVRRHVLHPYSDAPRPLATIACYSIVDLLAGVVAAALQRKCEFVGIDAPTLTSIHATPFRAEVEGEWANMLDHQLPSLPGFDHFWGTLEELFGWLQGAVALPTLPRAELGSLNTDWRAPRSMTSWRSGAPRELIRFAGANRLRVQIDYRAERGRQRPRIVEPYAFRKTRDGHIVLFVVNDQGYLRSYRTDRIAGVAMTRQPFRPRYRVEF